MRCLESVIFLQTLGIFTFCIWITSNVILRLNRLCTIINQAKGQLIQLVFIHDGLLLEDKICVVGPMDGFGHTDQWALIVENLSLFLII